MKKRWCVVFFLVLALVLPAGASAAQFSAVISFGDSLSDNGNLIKVNPVAVPATHYYQGRFTNGKVWVEYLTQILGLEGDKLMDQAYGGAQTSGDVPPSLINQVNMFLAASTIPSDALVTVWCGANDFLGGSTDYMASVGNIQTALGTLVAGGAKNILVLNLPDLGATPRNNGNQDLALKARLLTMNFNLALAATVNQFKQGYPSVNFYMMDIFGLLDEIIKNPANHGFKNVRDVNPNFGTSFNNDGGYVFWDEIHPTTQAHEDIAIMAANTLNVAGFVVAENLWIRGVIDTVEKGPVNCAWHKGGESTTTSGDRVLWGYFYAKPADVSWGSLSNPELFVKVWFDHSGRVDINYFHTSVPDIEVTSDYPYDGTVDQKGTATLSRRYIRHYCQNGQFDTDYSIEDGDPPAGYAANENPTSNATLNNLRIGAGIHTVEKGAISAVWNAGGQSTTERGDKVMWGYFSADPADVDWGNPNNPEVFVKIWFDKSGRVDVNAFHVSVPDIEIHSDISGDGAYDQQGTSTTTNRYIQHQYN